MVIPKISGRTLLTALGIAAAIGVLIFFIVKHNHALNVALSKLDSAVMRLDTAQVKIDSSRNTINQMRNELSEYQKTLSALNDNVKSLDKHSQEKEKQFSSNIQTLNKDYDKMKQNFKAHQRLYWPTVTIDTSRKQ
jgi:peptidoglycan hydrolase CwlO-like protein